jgi:hypothetical protein
LLGLNGCLIGRGCGQVVVTVVAAPTERASTLLPETAHGHSRLVGSLAFAFSFTSLLLGLGFGDRFSLSFRLSFRPRTSTAITPRGSGGWQVMVEFTIWFERAILSREPIIANASRAHSVFAFALTPFPFSFSFRSCSTRFPTTTAAGDSSLHLSEVTVLLFTFDNATHAFNHKLLRLIWVAFVETVVSGKLP